MSKLLLTTDLHQPPADLGMDLCGNGVQAGSPTLLRFIEEHHPLLGCSGHIHESPHQPGGQWAARIGDTIWLQPGQVDRRLHYVSFAISDALAVGNIRHNLFGPLMDFTKRLPDGRGTATRGRSCSSAPP